MIRRVIFSAAARAAVCVAAAAIAAVAPVCRAADAASRDLLPFQAEERTLDNGLKVIVVPTGFPDIVSLQIPVQTGSRNEVEPGKSGFAHFFEHMMARGTPAYPPDEYNKVISKAGARQNAYTTDDYTNYHITFAKDDLEAILKIEADRFQNLAYSEDAFKTESRAVLGEYNKNSADPSRQLFEAIRDRAFREHTYKHTTMGFLRDIEDMPNQYAYSKIFFDRWYRPGNTTIIIAGDVDAARAFALVGKYWGGWKPGSYRVQVPAEPSAQGPAYVHVPWPGATLPQVWVMFHGPAFSETAKDYAALKTLLTMSFGPTSELYKRLVQDEQKVDELGVAASPRADPMLVGVIARVKKGADAVDVRDQILRTVARIRAEPVSPQDLADARSAERYGLVRSLDNTEDIAATLATFVHFRRSYSTINEYYRTADSLTPADLQAAAGTYLTDAGMVVATLSKEALPEGIDRIPALASLQRAAQALPVATIVQKSPLPQVTFKILFAAGSAADPAGKEGLAALTASMVADGGSSRMRADEIARALFPMAGSFSAQVDKQMTTFTGSIHRDNWDVFLPIVLPMLLAPGLREDDFRRLKDAQKNALLVDLKDHNEEEFAKERLQANVYAGTPFGHPALGTARGIDAIALEDVRAFWKSAYARAAVRVGIAGDVSDAMVERLQRELAALPDGPGLPAPGPISGRKPAGIEVEIIRKDTRATAISFGFPIEVTRAHPDFAALWLARTWFGEHRSGTSHLFQRIRELRGMNYGDYAYIEAFPNGMFQFFPDPNRARSAQLFEVWIRPVAPENAQMALRIAVHELGQLVERGLTQDQFETTRDYLMKNVFLMTSTQDQQLGYALDSQWFKVPEYTRLMREALAKLSVDDVNRAIRRHLNAANLSVVAITRDADALRDALVADGFSPVRYDGDKPRELLDEDQVIGRLKLNIRADAVRITPAAEAFAQ